MRSLGILQVSHQRLFRILRCRQRSRLPRFSQTSTPRVLLQTKPRQNEMPLLQPSSPDHVPHRKKPGRLFFKCYRRTCPFFQWADQDPRGQNRAWLEADKFICLFDGRVVRRTPQDVLTETPLQRGVRKSIDQPMGPFEDDDEGLYFFTR